MKKIVIISGYFNPLHIGHINYIKEAKNFGDYLIAIVNNDEQVKVKGSFPFMPEYERVKITKAIRHIDEVFLSVDKNKSVCESLEALAKMHKGCELFFANGGDRNQSNIPEVEICKKFKIKFIDNVGGNKVQSSSVLLNNVANFKKDKQI